MKRWVWGLSALLVMAGCTRNPAPTGPVSASQRPAGVYQHTTQANPEWQNLRVIKPEADGTPVVIPPRLDADQLFSEGVTSLVNQRGAEAIACLSEVLRQSPERTAAAYQLGAAYELMGQLDKAKAVYQEALSHSPDDLDLKRALAALNGDFTMDGTPDRVEIHGPFLYFYDGTKRDWILEFQPWQGEMSLKTEVVDAGGSVPVVLVSSPQGTTFEVFRGDGFSAYGGQSVKYDPTRRQLIVQQPSPTSPDPVPPLGYLRFKLLSDGRTRADLQASPHGD